jgi:hypothetical protein
MEQLEKKMEDMKNPMSTILLQMLDERVLKGDIKPQGNHENVEEIKIELQIHEYLLSPDPHHQGFDVAPRNYLIPKIDMRNFDGEYPVTWIFHMEKFFDLHQVITLQKVTIVSLYLENVNLSSINGFVKETKILLSLGPFLWMNY